MYWRIYLKSGANIYKVLKIEQKNDDIYIFPSNSLYLSHDFLKDLTFGEELVIKESYLSDKINHYSAHSSGERHIKDLENRTVEIIYGDHIKGLSKPTPLITMVASTNKGSLVINVKGRWFGYNLPNDVNYLIFEIIAYPFSSILQFNQSFQINNDEKTRESFDWKVLNMSNCNIGIITRSSNNAKTSIPVNILFEHSPEKTIIITRVGKEEVLCQVSKISIKDSPF